MDPNRILMSVRPLDIRRVGRYGLQFSWSDLHGSGIYTYDLLRSLDPAAPAGPVPVSPGPTPRPPGFPN
jgi:hypothetical protein